MKACVCVREREIFCEGGSVRVRGKKQRTQRD